MSALTHRQAQDQIQSRQMLSAAEQAALAAHLAACPECRAYAAFHSQMAGALPGLYPARRHSPQELRQKSRALQTRLEQRARSGRLVHATRLAAAVGMALVALLAVLLLPGHLPRLLPGLLPQPGRVQMAAMGWQTYHDPQGRFSLEYPRGWRAAGQAQPHNGGVLQLAAPEAGAPKNGAPKNVGAKIEIGIYNQKISAGEDLAQWLDAYNQRGATFTPDQLQTHRRETVRVDGLEALHIVQTSPIGDYQYTVIRRADEVWFAWSTIGNSAPAADQAIYARVIQSLRFQAPSEQARLEPTTSPTPRAAATQAAAARPSQPRPTATAAALPVRTVARVGDMAYLGSGARLLAVDVSRPSAPRLAAQSEALPGEVVKILPLAAYPGAADTRQAGGEVTDTATPDAGLALRRTRVAASAGRYLAVFDITTPGELGLITQSKLPGPISALIVDINTNRLYAGGTQNSDPTQGFISLFDASPAETLDLLGTLTLDAPVRNLALNAGGLFVALGGARPGVSAIALAGDGFGDPRQVIPNLLVYSMTAAGDGLYIGSSGRLLAYRLSASRLPELAWQVEKTGGQPLPGPILSFELRPTSIYAAGLDATEQPFRLAIQPPEAIKASSTVDTASLVAVGDGLMLVAGERLEIYDILDTPNLKLLGAYPGN